MVEAYVLIQTVVGRTHAIAQEIGSIEGVDLAEPVAGPYDMIARLSASDFDALQQVEYKIELVDGVTRTLTCVIGKF